MVRRFSLLWEVTHRRLMVIFRRFGITSWDCLSLKDRFNRNVGKYLHINAA